ncbi:MAG: aryl-sulfate sulfotransferase [Bacteroidetes bacterium]|nr:aryl-sulfate sulfotransferase [Bacteroidota bacterium]
MAYVLPLPGARMVRGETNIAVVWEGVSQLEASSLAGMFRVSGSHSGTHEGVASLSDDARTALFKPAEPFGAGEQVEVQLRGPRGNAFSFVFHVSQSLALPLRRAYQDCCAQEDPITGGHLNALDPLFRDHGTHRIPAADEHTDALPDDLMQSARLDGRTPGISVPSDFPFVNVTVQDSPAEGKLFLTNLGGGNPYLLILENDGTPVFFRRTPGYARDFKVQPTGLLTYHLAGISNAFYVMDSSYAVVDSFRCGNGYETDEHELLMLPNGHVLLIGRDYQIVDMTPIDPDFSSRVTVIGNIIQELDTNHQVVFEWRSWDHFEITDCEHINLGASRIDYVHMNSIELDTDGNLIVSSRHMSEITKINRQTGEIIWRLGGKNNQFVLVNDPYGISFQHDARSQGGDRYTILDNGNFHDPRFSRAIEYAIDTAAMTATLKWEYRHSPDRYTWWMGNAQRLPNGNTLIGWSDGSLPKATEVRSDGTKAYELDFVEYAHCYRAFRFPWSGRAAVPDLVAETHRDTVRLIMNTFGDTSVVRYRIYGGTSPNPTVMIDSTASSMHQIRGLQSGAVHYFRVTAVRSNGEESGFSNEVSLQIRSVAPGENLLVNGDFALGTQPWSLVQSEGAVAYGYVTSAGEYRVEIGIGGPQTWSVQLKQDGVELINGKTYRFEFDVRASSNRTIATRVEQSTPPSTSYSNTGTIQLRKTTQHLSYTFTMSSPTDRNARVVFNCGKYGEEVFLDNVSVREILPTDVGSERGTAPDSYALDGAYPNPFNPFTTIQYSLPELSHVRMVVYNAIGQLVATLIDTPADSGTHEVQFDGRNLSSGVYVCRMDAKPVGSASGFSAAMKVLLVK